MSRETGRARPAKSVNLALQGGAAHGAFTWGVLDRLLEDGRLQFEALSGTSAGAMNAVVVADGYMRDGPEGARQSLEDFWKAMSRAGSKSFIRRSPLSMLTGSWTLADSPGYLALNQLLRIASPYELNPLNYNPLRDLLESQIDFERVTACDQMKLFISATNVHTGRVKVFGCGEISADVVLASSCLPQLFQAVEIDGVPYWDGGFMGNPVLFPFFYACDSRDVLLVQINPIERNETPRTARAIQDRMSEIVANGSLLKELRAIEFVSRLIDLGKLDPKVYKQILFHRVGGGETLAALPASSKLNPEWKFLVHLRDLGREAAKRWLDESFEKIGKASTVDLRKFFAG